MASADNYAMYATLAWFQDKWEWTKVTGYNEKDNYFSYPDWHVTDGHILQHDDFRRSAE
jgi:hypothetical protein